MQEWRRPCRQPPPAGLQHALLDQNDLQSVPGASGIQVFKNPEAIPITAQRARPVVLSKRLTWPGPLDVKGWQPVLSALASHAAANGVVTAGTIYAGYAPAGSFSLTQRGRTTLRPIGIRLGPAVFGCRHRIGHPVVAAISLRPLGGPGRALGVGRVGAGAPRVAGRALRGAPGRARCREPRPQCRSASVGGDHRRRCRDRRDGPGRPLSRARSCREALP